MVEIQVPMGENMLEPMVGRGLINSMLMEVTGFLSSLPQACLVVSCRSRRPLLFTDRQEPVPFHCLGQSRSVGNDVVGTGCWIECSVGCFLFESTMFLELTRLSLS